MDDPPSRRRLAHKLGRFRWLLIAIMVAAVALAALIATAAYFSPTNSVLAGVCGTLSIERRGLPCDIPLPANARLDASHAATGKDSGGEYDWTFTLPRHWEIEFEYYQRAFPAHGWPCVGVTRFEGLYVTASGKTDRPGDAVTVSFIFGNATSTQIQIILSAHPDLPPFLTCALRQSGARPPLTRTIVGVWANPSGPVV